MRHVWNYGIWRWTILSRAMSCNHPLRYPQRQGMYSFYIYVCANMIQLP